MGLTIKDKNLMPNKRYVMIRTIEDQLAIIKSMGQHEMFVTTDIMQEILAMLKEHEPVIEVTRSVSGMTIKENNKVYLCKSCTYNYQDCPAEIDSVEFGDDVGCDNICCCNQYEPILEKDFERGGYK